MLGVTEFEMQKWTALMQIECSQSVTVISSRHTL